MKPIITVREYACLTTQPVTASIDLAQISVTAFDWLLSESFSKSGAALVQLEGRFSLKLDNFVGIVETPCGTLLEILPKHFEEGDCKKQSRALLRKMISKAMNLPVRKVGISSLELFDAPLSEWVMNEFLQALEHLVKKGIRFDYQRIEEEQKFLRGQLNIVAQMRQPPARQHQFQIRHDIFLPDRPENRLLKLALEKVCQSTQDGSNWRLAHELRGLLSEVPASKQISDDFKAWRNDRLMAHYQTIKPWCELIINRHMPLAVAGQWQGMSMLFPMETLFERYVESWLRQNLLATAQLKAQATSQYLCQHDNARMFCLKPDFLVNQEKQIWVLDAKWKRLSGTDKANKYGLSQADFYQLFAYGHKYLDGKGELILIYPKLASFKDGLPVFNLGSELNLWVLPFDLDNDQLVNSSLSSLPLKQQGFELEDRV